MFQYALSNGGTNVGADTMKAFAAYIEQPSQLTAEQSAKLGEFAEQLNTTIQKANIRPQDKKLCTDTVTAFKNYGAGK